MSFDSVSHQCGISPQRERIVTPLPDGSLAVELWVLINPDVNGGCLAVPRLWRCRCTLDRWLARNYRTDPGLVPVKVMGVMPPLAAHHPLNDPRD